VLRGRQVVVATGPFQVPYLPAAAQRLDGPVTQLHSAGYRNPQALPSGPALVVGGGSSGFQIAEELAAGRPVDLSIATKAPVLRQRLAGRDLFWWLTRLGLLRVTAGSRLGRRMSGREFVIGSSRRRLKEAGVRFRPAVTGAGGRTVRFADGTSLDAGIVIWATGCRPDCSWLGIPGVTRDGQVARRRGVTDVPGLYFVGLSWPHTRGSALPGFVHDDAAFLAGRIAARHQTGDLPSPDIQAGARSARCRRAGRTVVRTLEGAAWRCPAGGGQVMRVCIVGASGKLGQYMVQHALDRGYEVAGVCREQSVAKLDAFTGRITVIPGATDDREVIRKAVAGCDGVLTVLVPRGVRGYSTGTAQAVLDLAAPGARLVFSCGWHISRDGQDVYSRRLKWKVAVLGGFGRLVRAVDLDDQVEACRRVFASDTRWTVVRGSELEEGESQGLPVWSRHVGDPILASNITRRVDFALFLVAALENDALIHEAPAIVGCRTPSALAHAADAGRPAGP
jgi:NAD(P)H-binding/Pyridine nucleotide-disulphide oxidoreductase